MAYSKPLADRIRAILPGCAEKEMFGGICFLVDGKMFSGIVGEKLMARIGPDNYEAALKKPHVKPMDFTGKPLKGYIFVEPAGIKTKAQLSSWVHKALEFTKTAKASPKRKTVSEISSHKKARATPLKKLINFGPVTIKEFHAMGIMTFGDLEDLGFEEACRKWVENFPERLNANAFLGVIATLEGISWTKASPSDRARAKALVRELRKEYG